MRYCLENILILTIVLSFECLGQPNCYVYKDDEPCYKGCLEALEALRFSQGSNQSQIHFDNSIGLCSKFDYAYFEKAVPYLKRGDFITWKKLIDKAVSLNPTQYLGYRGWCRFQFLRDYIGAIGDLEKLDSLTSFDIGYSINGDYHLKIALALCYEGVGQRARAIQIIEKQLMVTGYTPGLFDYLHLGVLKIKMGNLKEGIDALKKQISYNDYLAEAYFFLGLAYKKLHLVIESKESFEKAKTFYLKGYKRLDPYTTPMHRVYFSDIKRELGGD